MSILQGFKDSVVELRGVVNHHYQDKDKAYASQASIFKINYNLWLYIYQFLWTREIASYDQLINTIKSDTDINSMNWRRIFTIILIVCTYSLLRSRLLMNYQKNKVKEMVDTNKEEVWKKLNHNKERGVSEWDGDYNAEVEEKDDSSFSFGKKSKAKYKKNVELLQKQYEQIQQQQVAKDDDLDDIMDLLED